MKLHGNKKRKITNDKDCENVVNLKITEVHCNIVNKDYQQD